MLAAVAQTPGEPPAAAIVAVIVGGILLYFAPTIVAVARGLRHQGQVFVVNLFTGWTFFGWVIALVMALRPKAAA